MKEISKFFRIYCNENHKKWAELIPHIETLLNITVASATGLTPTDLMFGGKGPNIFEELLPEGPEGRPVLDDIQAKIAQAYKKMVRKINSKKRDNRKGRAHWKPTVEDEVLLRTQPMSDAGAGITAKFMHPYEGQYLITKLIPPSTFELADEKGRIRGQFNKKLLKAYREATTAIEC
jgi:hypothetical protein